MSDEGRLLAPAPLGRSAQPRPSECRTLPVSPRRLCLPCGHYAHMMRHALGRRVTAAYASPRELDLADPSPRSGPLPRALVAVSNVLTIRRRSTPLRSTDVGEGSGGRPRTPRTSRRAMTTTSGSNGPSAPTRAAQIDPRGPQFNAMLTSVVLALTLITAPATAGIALLGVQTALFATAVVLGVQRTPAAYLFKTFVRPRLAAPAHLEDPQPPRFAQGVGLVFAAVGLVGYLSGATVVGAIATGFALAAALLNAVFGFCLGCEMYLLIRRIAPARNTPVHTNA